MIVPPKVLADWLIVRPLAAAERTPSGLYLPTGSQVKPSHGEVLHCGPGSRDPATGELIPSEVSVGDEVLYNRFTGIPVAAPGYEDTLAMKEHEVLIIL